MRRVTAMLFLTVFLMAPESHGESTTVHVDRKNRKLFLVREAAVTPLGPIGIGRGGLRLKKDMSDLVTPTGTFTVDLVLFRDPSFDAVSPEAVRAVERRGEDATILGTPAGLRTLFESMNSLDFDGDGKPDHSYGSGYIGLRSDDAVTGPKLTRFRGGPLYWFSIALHGTPKSENIGAANSGGCVHLSADTLRKLVTERILEIGTRVVIADSGPMR